MSQLLIRISVAHSGMALPNSDTMDEQVYLNVGGVYFVTRRTTLINSNSFFAGAVRVHSDCCELFVDRDPTHFRYILNWIRGVRHLPEDASVLDELLWEADYYCIPDMCAAITQTKNRVSLHSVLSKIQKDVQNMRQQQF